MRSPVIKIRFNIKKKKMNFTIQFLKFLSIFCFLHIFVLFDETKITIFKILAHEQKSHQQ